MRTLRHGVGWLVASWPALSSAHGFGERYDLPIPLGYFVLGACATVLLTWAVALRMGHRHGPSSEGWILPIDLHQPALMFVRRLCQGVGLGLLWLTTWAALAGTGDPLMNLAPTWIWIIWWIGLSLWSALVGPVWPALDPWRSLYEGLQFLARRLGFSRLSLGWSWPQGLGVWPAVLGLLAWNWLEVVYALPSSPHRVGWAILGWSALQLAGMCCFGRATWQEHADVFALYFRHLSRMAPLQITDGGRRISIGALGHGWHRPEDYPVGSVGLVIAMLATVLFDGVHSSAYWLVFQGGLEHAIPMALDVNGHVAGALGLLGVWGVLALAYGWTCGITAYGFKGLSRGEVAQVFLPTLIPIAVGYLLAHNYSGLVIQGQHVVALLSDPLGRQWNVWGSAGQPIDITWADARTTWYVALWAIVSGHVIAVWWSHRLALLHWSELRLAKQACLPLTLLMVGYTAISLILLAQPLVEPAG